MKLSGTGPAHRLDECEISVQEQRFSGGVQGPAKPAVVGFTADKPASGSRPFESFPAYAFWWKLSEYGSTQRKPKCCGILRILASAFRFYLNPPGFPSSSRFYPEL